MNFCTTFRNWLDYFREGRVVIRDSLGLKEFLARPAVRKGSAENMVKKQARHLRKQMDVALNHQWKPKIVENEKKVVKMKRRGK